MAILLLLFFFLNDFLMDKIEILVGGVAIQWERKSGDNESEKEIRESLSYSRCPTLAFTLRLKVAQEWGANHRSRGSENGSGIDYSVEVSK